MNGHWEAQRLKQIKCLLDIHGAKEDSRRWVLEMGKQKLVLVFLLGFASIFYLVFSSEITRRSIVVPAFPPPGTEKSQVCGTQLGKPSPTTIYFITPTYPRREQVAELTRLGQTLLHVKDLHWIVAEDCETCSPLVRSILQRFNIPFTHISSPQPQIYKQLKMRHKPRGVASRRASLRWILHNIKEGIVYFGDDDNTYDLRLFDEIRKTEGMSMFPVGLIGQQGVSSPIVREGILVGFSDAWFSRRKFPVDMAGFAINIDFLKERNPQADTAMPYQAGFEEDFFLRSLNINLTEIEPLANNCTEVLVWHTQTMKGKKSDLYVDRAAADTSLTRLLKYLQFSGISEPGPGEDPMSTCFHGDQCTTDNSKLSSDHRSRLKK